MYYGRHSSHFASPYFEVAKSLVRNSVKHILSVWIIFMIPLAALLIIIVQAWFADNGWGDGAFVVHPAVLVFPVLIEAVILAVLHDTGLSPLNPYVKLVADFHANDLATANSIVRNEWRRLEEWEKLKSRSFPIPMEWRVSGETLRKNPLILQWLCEKTIDLAEKQRLDMYAALAVENNPSDESRQLLKSLRRITALRMLQGYARPTIEGQLNTFMSEGVPPGVNAAGVSIKHYHLDSPGLDAQEEDGADYIKLSPRGTWLLDDVIKRHLM